MSELPKNYDFKTLEPYWYNQWLAKDAFKPVVVKKDIGCACPLAGAVAKIGRFFKKIFGCNCGCKVGDPEQGSVADASKGQQETYTIVMPPPNVTGVAHMGHFLNNTLQDILIRRARLEGKAALWIPGTDHAGLSTQVQVERAMRKEGLTKHDISREEFMKRILAWCEEKGTTIITQLKAMGISCDWSRKAYTMDPAYHRAVLHAFVELYKKGYIYRGYRMVNWCPVSQTGLSDEEVIMKEEEGIMCHMKYEVVESPGEFIEIETTRPETIMGDTAVAVHPKHPKYAKYIGQHVWRPFPRAKIRVIGDEAADPAFGTGALKVTPAHDMVDFAIGKRHNLEVIDIFNPDATLNAKAGSALIEKNENGEAEEIKFEGLTREKAREAAILALKKMGLLIAIKPYKHSVGYSERAGVPIEPRLSEQWWLKYPKIEEAKKVVRDGIIEFHPKRWEKVYLHWLENIQDWCISRQVIWGQRIPVWYRKAGTRRPDGSTVVYNSREDRNDAKNLHCSVDGPSDPENWEQEKDVLDTWASSWIWPLATMGWPDEQKMKEAGFDNFYPTTTLSTAPEIIFFWVARMIIASLEFRKGTLEERVPFRHVYFNGTVRSEDGRKMSKSWGNVVDPMDLFEKYGADGSRFGLIRVASTGQDISFDEDMVEQGRNFCTKLWNASRFRQMQENPPKVVDSERSERVGDPEQANVVSASKDGKNIENQQFAKTLDSLLSRLNPTQMDAYDHWILTRLIETTRLVEKSFAEFDFAGMTQGLYAFFWGDFCDWYVEAVKSRLRDDAQKAHLLALQDIVLRQTLQLLEPITPHITEELWAKMGFSLDGKLIQQTKILTAAELEKVLRGKGIISEKTKAAVENVSRLSELVEAGRALKADAGFASRRDVEFILKASGDAVAKALEPQREVLERFLGAKALTFVTADKQGCPARVTPLGTLYLEISSAVTPEDKAKLAKQLEEITRAIASAETKLNNPTFTGKAPANVIDGVKSTLAQNKVKAEEIRKLIGG